MTYPTNRSPFGQNRTPTLLGLAYQDNATIVPLAADDTNGALLVEIVSGGGTNQDVNLVQIGGHTVATAANGLQEVALNDGTNTANVVAGDSGYNALPVANSTKTLTFSTSSSGAQILLTNTDCRGYGFITVVATSVGSGLAWSGQFAPNSGGTYITSQTWSNAGQGGNQAGALNTSANQLYSSPVYGPYFQLNVTALTSGTLSGYVVLSTQPMPYHAITAVQGGTWTVGSNSATGSAVPANAFAIGVENNSGNLTNVANALRALSSDTSGTGMATANTLYNGSSWEMNRSANAAAGTTGTGLLGAGTMIFDGTDWQSTKDGTGRGDGDTTGYMGVQPRLYNGSTYDRMRSGGVTGMQGVSLQASPSGGYSYLHIAAGQATTTVKSGAGTLHAIIFNGAATATNVTTIYDNTAGSGTVIGIPAATAVTTPESVIYDLAFGTGLTIVTGTANGSDMTVVYK